MIFVPELLFLRPNSLNVELPNKYILRYLRERKRNNPARAPYEPAWPDQKTDRQNVTFYVKQY